MERIEGFADPERELRRYYRTRWQAMLEVLLGWPTEAAARWASYEIDTHQRARPRYLLISLTVSSGALRLGQWPVAFICTKLLRGIRACM